VCIAGYLRPEMNFSSLEALITAIRKDITDAEQLLEEPELLKLKNYEFFTPANSTTDESQHTTTNGNHTNGHST
jgi:riboflavin kinase